MTTYAIPETKGGDVSDALSTEEGSPFGSSIVRVTLPKTEPGTPTQGLAVKDLSDADYRCWSGFCVTEIAGGSIDVAFSGSLRQWQIRKIVQLHRRGQINILLESGGTNLFFLPASGMVAIVRVYELRKDISSGLSKWGVSVGPFSDRTMFGGKQRLIVPVTSRFATRLQ